MALLGLPVAQELTPIVSGYEKRLADLLLAISPETGDDHVLLHTLSELSADLAGVVAATCYRTTASKAYADISSDRLESLRVGRIKGHQTLGDFTDRRLLPAVRTCISFSARLEDLSQRLACTSSLLRTRVDTALSRQNRNLLAFMDRRTDLQLRLQQTVEGLSVVAISYYVIGRLKYVIKGLPIESSGSNHDLLVAAAVLAVAFNCWVAMRRLRSKHSR